MATIVLGSVGAALGGSLGGSFLGLSSMVIGRAVGATVGRAIDQRIMGGGAEAVETGRIDRFRLTSAAEGAPIPRVVGRYRVGGQVIWAGPFREHRATSGGGKGGPPKPEVTELSYTVSLAVAVCEGEIARIGRVWADGQEVARGDVEMRVYPGSEDQLPDPLIAAVEGEAPAHRGVAYVVFEDLALGAFGNRVPQFSFEVVRPVRSGEGDAPTAAELVRGVAVIPGTGEHSLATEPLTARMGPGRFRDVNVNGMTGEADLVASMRDLREEVPGVRAASLVVSWFGDDLRCGDCTLRPMVEHRRGDPEGHPWAVAGETRGTAAVVPEEDGRVVYGGTPTDRSVVEAIRHMGGQGLDVTFYPFVLMTPMTGSGLPDPWGGAEQPALPWRGRVTCMPAPGVEGSADRTAAAEAQVAAFFGTAAAADFVVEDGSVSYSGPAEWSYRRFILHYAALCAAAGGVEAFCVGSEMRGLTPVRGADDAFPAVEALRVLAAEVRALLPMAKIGYAADWSEYFGYQPPEGGGALLFHLDPLWADDAIDFVGIDNYMPLSDWRPEGEHLDAHWGAVHDLEYLRSGVEGGEGFEWFYPTEEARAAQRRAPITDGEGEPWVWRYKDVRSWWGTNHFDRPGGVRSEKATAWEPGMKPIRFTELGCPAVHLGTNQPNVFVDPKSSESALPRHSDGTRDDAIQMQYLRAVLGWWSEPGRNPRSPLDGRAMLDLEHSCVWAWDARPWPAFPAKGALWSDAPNWERGHWWSGRAAFQPLSSAIAELCREAGVAAFDVSGVHGAVRGTAWRDVGTARSDLQSLLLAHGVDVAEVAGVLRFSMRGQAAERVVDPGLVARGEGAPVAIERSAAPEVSGRVRVHHVDAGGAYEPRVGDAVQPGGEAVPVHDSELDVALTRGEGQALAERFLAEARVARERIALTLPPSRRDVAPGDLIAVAGARWRVDRLTEGAGRAVEAVRADPSVFRAAAPVAEAGNAASSVNLPGMVDALFLDLPLLRGDEVAHAPHVAALATPWQGRVAVHGSWSEAGFTLDAVVTAPSRAGVLASDLFGAAPATWDEGAPLLVDLGFDGLESAESDAVLAGANAIAVGSGDVDDWEIVQFRRAELVGPGRWALSGRLRGVRGTEDAILPIRPAGSWFVVLEDLGPQLPVAPEHLGRVRHLRYGPAAKGPDHAHYRSAKVRIGGRGLRPYAPAHLRVAREGEAWRVSWVRRTRMGGDVWDGRDVPLGEAREAYRVRVLSGDDVVSVREVAGPEVVLAAGEVPAGAVVEVAQVSDRAGAGAAARVAPG